MLRNLLTKLRMLLLGRSIQKVVSPREAEVAIATDPSPSAATFISGGSDMNAAYEQLIQHLEERDVRYLTSGEGHSVCADFRCEHGTYRVIATVDEEGGLFQVFGYPSLRVPVGARPAIAETIVRANYALRVGKFELDVDEGELRFQAAQILTEDYLEDEVIDRLMSTTMAMLDIYLPAILSVIYGNELPQDAIRHVEANRFDGREPDGDEGEADD